MHAVEFLKRTPDEVTPVLVLSGEQRYLKQNVLALLRRKVIDDDETSFTRFPGDSDLQTISDELRTVSMWGDRRLVLVEDADEFVKSHRAGIEKLVEKPAKKSVLVLDVNSWPKNTRLYKLIAATGLEIECSELAGPALLKWLQDSAQQNYGQTLARDAAVLLIELVGEQFGLLDTELAKLASYCSTRGKITAEDVSSLVGGWRTETTWEMNDATRDNRLNDALVALDRLLAAGEAPLKLLGGISYSFKKFAYATEFSRSGGLDQALRQAGIFPQALGASQSYLRRLGRGKAERILHWLIETDSGLKGSSPLPDRVQLERLLIELSGHV